MKIHIITIFPESFESYFSSSIIWRARDEKKFELELYKLNDFSNDNNKRVDNKAYWMHGQVISAEPLSKAIEYIFNNIWYRIPVIYMSPDWDLLNQAKVEKYYEELKWDFIIICGHYEWIDQRIIDIYVDSKISIWEYVLSSGELSASVFLDAFIRHIPGVLWNIDSLKEDSFSEYFWRKKEHPVYTRPQEFKGKKVPDILLSGDHKKIEKWKKDNLW
jgi:tRNA (guanine37-N1)-methyltransferase